MRGSTIAAIAAVFVIALFASSALFTVGQT